MQQGCLFFHYFLATSKTNCAQIFTGYFIHKCLNTVRILVFDNYQKYTLPLTRVKVI